MLRASTENDGIFEFNKLVIDATHDLVCTYKPQVAHYASRNAEAALEKTIDYIHTTYPGIPVILDAKRGDIGSTAQHYAIEAFERYKADAVTVNPYLGGDSLQPFLSYGDRGVIILCRTSNPGSKDIQEMLVDGKPLYMHIAKLAATEWNTLKNVLLVVGATQPSALAQVRNSIGEMPLLVPGIGAQGGDIELTIQAGQTQNGHGLIINSSRAILYHDVSLTVQGYSESVREATLQLRDQINSFRKKPLSTPTTVATPLTTGF